ncbi:DUF4132 domain-containing protein [Nocardia sp. NPDC055321]
MTTSPGKEERWLVPKSWRTKAAPFRGVNDPAPRAIDPNAASAVQPVLEVYRPQIERSLRLTREQGHGGIADAAEGYLEAAGTGSPLGAAAIWSLVAEDYHSCGCTSPLVHAEHLAEGILDSFLDSWILLRGYGFAAEAAVLCNELDPQRGFDTQKRCHHYPLRPMPAGEGSPWAFRRLALPVRARLAEAPEREYRDVVARLAKLRAAPGTVTIRVSTSYLLPEQQDWVNADLTTPAQRGAPSPHRLLASALISPEQLELLQPNDIDDKVEYNLLTQVGIAAVPLVIAGFRTMSTDWMPTIRAAAGLLAELPTDDAYLALLDRSDLKPVAAALSKAGKRYPRRAMRLLSARLAETEDAVLRKVFQLHALAHPELAAEFSPVSETEPVLPDADPRDLPELLTAPPWPTERPYPHLIPLAAPHRPVVLRWAPGEREQWCEPARLDYPYDPELSWDSQLREAIAAGAHAALLDAAPAEYALDALRTVEPGTLYSWGFEPAHSPLLRLLARYDIAAVGFAVAAARTDPDLHAEILGPLDGTEIALIMLRWCGAKATRDRALPWFERHAGTAAIDVVAVALGPVGKDRSLAEATLRELVALGHRPEIDAAAAELGSAAVAAISIVLPADPLRLLGVPVRKPPTWLAPELLPRIRTRSATAVLPLAATRHLLTMCLLTTPDEHYPGLPTALAVLDPDDVADFAWAVFESWEAAGYPGKDAWVLHVLRLVGTEATMSRLAAVIGTWPGRSAYTRATSGLAVLTAFGTRTTLRLVERMTRKPTSEWLRSEATQVLAAVSAARGVDPDAFAEYLLPDLGLDADGTRVLDYGPRQFVIGIDAALQPTVTLNGTPRATAPAPAASDDPVAGPAAHQAFRTFKADLKTYTKEQIQRLERAMVTGRRWTPRTHRELFLDHPVLRPLARRVVWATFGPDGAPTGSFRIEEDRTRADATDTLFDLPPDTLIGVAHPLHLPNSLGRWREVFHDYELLQPFEQIDRAAPVLTPEDAASNQLARFVDRTVTTGNIYGLSKDYDFAWNLTDGIWTQLDPTHILRIRFDSGSGHFDQNASGHRIVAIDLDHGTFADLSLTPIALTEFLRRLERFAHLRAAPAAR